MPAKGGGMTQTFAPPLFIVEAAIGRLADPIDRPWHFAPGAALEIACSCRPELSPIAIVRLEWIRHRGAVVLYRGHNYVIGQCPACQRIYWRQYDYLGGGCP
jgi:hypothetical protein